MNDIVDSATRSRMMAGIRSKNTKPEILIRKLLHRQGFRFRLHVNNLPGKPDIVLPRYRAVIFVHGCFWHGHDCPFFKMPKTRTEFWHEKITRNQTNDKKNNELLLEDDWRVATIWECTIRGAEGDLNALAERLSQWLRGNEKLLEEKQ